MTLSELHYYRWLKRNFKVDLVFNPNDKVKVKSLNFDGSISYHEDTLENAIKLLDRGSVVNRPIRFIKDLKDEIEEFVKDSYKKIAKYMSKKKGFNPQSLLISMVNQINNHIINDTIDKKYDNLHKIANLSELKPDDEKDMVSISLKEIKGKIYCKLKKN